MRFQIHLADCMIEFEDVIQLSVEQQNLIHDVSQTRTQSDWFALEKGLKIPVDSAQQLEIITLKNGLVSGKDKRDLMKSDTIMFTRHSRERIAVRVNHVSKHGPPSIESLLTYTLYHSIYNERFKVAVSFEMMDQERIRVITVSNDHIQELTTSLMDEPEIKRKLEEFKKRLLRSE
ncbi:hypothetical protein [Cohnella fermenti]|uniref:Uncharacterized protein n=1 Tax=Cohnella fermenti TaxID=2565925 RepID=A0A4S4BZU0_9BACL|nr:hypothetical protein [Cohnella fermenti]THF80827.1 hypothetical protein E6C55_10110 [Cohnella fermenti]